MTPQDIRRIRKRIDATLENFRSVYGCYVNGAGEIISTMEISILDMDEEEKDMYSKIFRKVLSGRPERNLVDLEFTAAQAGKSDEHKLLMALKESQLKDDGLRNLLCTRIIENYSNDGDGYLILLAADTYDLASKDSKSSEWSEESTEQFEYFICAICPVKTSKAALQYKTDDQEFRGISTGTVLSAPALGFMFPVLDDGGADIYRVLYYSKSSADIHDELISGLFNTERIPMAADVQKENFNYALSDALGKECNLDIITALQAQMASVAEAEKSEKTDAVPKIAVEDVDDILAAKGVSDEGRAEFREALGKRFDGESEFVINNLIQNKSFEVKTPETRIVTEPENALRLKTKTIDGVTYIFVPIGESITVNGVEISVDFEEE